MTLFPQILSEKQAKVAESLDFLKFPPYYLGGGTALALQIGHRTSLDFDFYSKDKFESQSLYGKIRSKYAGARETVDQTEDTLQIVANGVNLSVFYYPYELVDDLIEFEGIKLAGLKDIAAMKMIAIVQRARQRDFVDMYYLVNHLGMKTVMDSVYKKYPWYADNNQILLKALTYFDEADLDSEMERIKIFDHTITWERVKKELESAVIQL